MNFLNNNVQYTERKRTRLCAHQDTEEKLHEMFVVYTNSTYMRPNKHPKDESVQILAGAADFVFFDQDGKVTDVLQMGDQHSGKPFYVRVPKEIYHTMLMRTERSHPPRGAVGAISQGQYDDFRAMGSARDRCARYREFQCAG